MKVLVTGTEGYIGSLLAPLLIQQGHEVIGLDTGFYKVGWLYNGTKVTFIVEKCFSKKLDFLAS